ncbi:unnamed protein product [Lactuca saligna]|uniref:Uncharacterized protein n=1 Tax=Lactuca saligna TaxID=75948 RepID=A0AA35Y8S2_LACSI|nr:unnamed protein product [Lactuca saligna]
MLCISLTDIIYAFPFPFVKNPKILYTHLQTPFLPFLLCIPKRNHHSAYLFEVVATSTLLRQSLLPPSGRPPLPSPTLRRYNIEEEVHLYYHRHPPPPFTTPLLPSIGKRNPKPIPPPPSTPTSHTVHSFGSNVESSNRSLFFVSSLQTMLLSQRFYGRTIEGRRIARPEEQQNLQPPTPDTTTTTKSPFYDMWLCSGLSECIRLWLTVVFYFVEGLTVVLKLNDSCLNLIGKRVKKAADVKVLCVLASIVDVNHVSSSSFMFYYIHQKLELAHFDLHISESS